MVVGLGLLGVLVRAEDGLAQAADTTWHLSVRPRALATGTQNPAAGEYPLDSVPDALVTVPAQCTGGHRCPLLVQLPGGGMAAREMTAWLRPVAAQYGLLLLAPTDYATRTIEAALHEVLRRFAIEPDKLAIVGRGASGGAAMRFGLRNADVFTRVASISGGVVLDSLPPQGPKPELFLSLGIRELGGSQHERLSGGLEYVDTLRQAGYTVQQVLALREHGPQLEDYDALGRWLQTSWATPNPAARPAPQVIADSLPLLTPAMLQRMTAFWVQFAQEPEAIRSAGRRAHLQDVAVPVETARPTVVMTDMTALAAQYPAVAADLKQAGLTAREHDVDRVALLSALVTAELTWEERHMPGWTPPTPAVLWQNVAFVDEHWSEFQTLEQAGVLHPEKVGAPLVGPVVPSTLEALGPMGIWRTP